MLRSSPSTILRVVLPKEIIEVLFEPEKLLQVVIRGFSKEILWDYAAELTSRLWFYLAKRSLMSFLSTKQMCAAADAVNLSWSYPLVQEYFFKQLIRISNPLMAIVFFLPSAVKKRLLRIVSPSKDERDSVQFFNRTFYSKGALYAVFVGGVIPVFAQVIASAHLATGYGAALSNSSNARKVKKCLVYVTFRVVETTLTFSTRVIGAKIGMYLGHSKPETGAIFICQYALPFLLSPRIHHYGWMAALSVHQWLEEQFPATEADREEDAKEEKEAQDEASWSATVSSTTESLYKVLHVLPTATPAEIRQAYRTQSLQYHPDRVAKNAVAQQDAQSKMAVINEAYEILSDAKKRKAYDSSLSSKDITFFNKTPEELSRAIQRFPSPVVFVLSVSGIVFSSAALLLVGYSHLSSNFRNVTSPGW